MTEFSGEIHPLADLFPMLPDDDLDALAESIAEHGQREPITLDADGRLIDGRNRLAACERAGVDPTFAALLSLTDESAVAAFINDKNTERRHLSPGQRAVGRALMLAAQGKRKDGRWMRGTSKNLTDNDADRVAMTKAGVLIDHDTDRGTTFAEQVLSGSLALDAAHKSVMQIRKAEQDAAEQSEHDIRRLARLDGLDSRLAELVRAEQLSIDEAWAAWEKSNAEQVAAEQEALNAWNDCCDSLARVLAYFHNGVTPPAEIPTHRPQVTDLLMRVDTLTQLVKEYR